MPEALCGSPDACERYYHAVVPGLDREDRLELTTEVAAHLASLWAAEPLEKSVADAAREPAPLDLYTFYYLGQEGFLLIINTVF